MSALASTGAELRRFRRGTLPKVAILALVLIPLLYGALYLWAFWDPTGRMGRLPVALVDADRPATMSDGTPVHAGQDVVDTLLEDGSLHWVTTDAADAEQGVKDGTYYFAVTLPEDFSSAVVSAGGDDPHQARIDVTYSDANSFLASTLGHSAMVQVDDAVRESIGTQAVDQVLLGLGSARDGFATAADGAYALKDATAQLAAGATSLTAGADSAHSGAAQLAAGASQAATGASALSTGLGQAATGAATLSDGAATAAAGAGSLASGATTLAGGLDQASAGAVSLDEGAKDLAAGVDSAVSTFDALATSLSAAPAALTDVATYLTGRAMGGDTAALTALHEIQAVATGLTSVDMTATSEQLAELQAGAHQVATGAATLDASMTKLDAGAHGVASGAGDLATGTAQLATGAADLVGGASRLATGADDLATGTAQLATGTAQLATGTAQLADGAHQLADGTTQLDTGAGSLASGLQDGTSAIPADTDAQRAARGDVISTPVSLSEQHLTKAEGFGEGFAPFFISLALFVGALITFLMLRPLPTRALATPASGWRAAFGGFLPAAYLALAQVVVMLVVIHVGVGLTMSTALGTTAFTALVALSFVALQQMINAVFGSAPGKVIILALLMLQLASSGGTYPVETTPAFFRAIHPWLPMSYAVQGLREVVTGGVDGRLWACVAVLGALLVGSLAVTAWRAGRMRTWTLSRLHPAISL